MTTAQNDPSISNLRQVRNVLRSEDITEPKDVIPTGRMARVIARTRGKRGKR